MSSTADSDDAENVRCVRGGMTGQDTTNTTVRSAGAYDGWVLESSEKSGRGGAVNSTTAYLLVGDDSPNRQYVSIVSFDTAPLPDNAVVLSAKLGLFLDGFDTRMFVTHGPLLVDTKRGAFSGAPALQASDFEAEATSSGVGKLAYRPASWWYSFDLPGGSVNLKGVTQLRLRFAKDDNDDAVGSALRFTSGNFADEARRPAFEIEYFVL